MVAPVTQGVQVVRGVIAVVEAEAVGLGILVWLGEGKKTSIQRGKCKDSRRMQEIRLTGTSISVMLDRKSEFGSTSSTSAC
jgi:hypothetical protein